MMTLEKALEKLGGRPDQVTLEVYISRAWVRPVKQERDWRFEDIDIARARLVHHLQHDMRLHEDGVDMMLGLLDQVYGMREQMRRVRHAISRQPKPVQDEMLALIRAMGEEITI